MAKPKVTTDARGHIHIRLDAGVAATVSRGISQRSIDSLRKMAKAAKAAKDADLKKWVVQFSLKSGKRVSVPAMGSTEADAIRNAKEQLSDEDATYARVVRTVVNNWSGDQGKPCGCKH